MRGTRRRFWAAAAANIAVFALLLRALLLPFGCPADVNDAGLAFDESASFAICMVHSADTSGADTQSIPSTPAQHTTMACATSACCVAAAPVTVAALDLPPADHPVFALERWQSPAGPIHPALRNRGPPLSPSV
jgi:hypothetical protein